MQDEAPETVEDLISEAVKKTAAMLKITIDTNVLISAILNSNGIPAEILQRVRRGEIRLIFSRDILAEVRCVLRYPKLRKLFKRKGISEDIPDAFIDQ